MSTKLTGEIPREKGKEKRELLEIGNNRVKATDILLLMK